MKKIFLLLVTSLLFYVEATVCSYRMLTNDYHRAETIVMHNGRTISKKRIKDECEKTLSNLNLEQWRTPDECDEVNLAGKTVKQDRVIIRYEYVSRFFKKSGDHQYLMLHWTIYDSTIEDAVQEYNNTVGTQSNNLSAEIDGIFPIVLAKLVLEYAQQSRIEIVE